MWAEAKRVWITGASSGLGEALAYRFSKEGAKLILSARRARELERVRDRCGRAAGDILVLPFDMSDHGSFPDHVARALRFGGRIDILLLNAGISQRGLVKDTDLSVHHSLMSTNYFGPVALTKAVLPSMLESRSGHIVVVSSVLGKFGTQLKAGYCASKHALHGFFDSLRAELYSEKIKVTLVCPGIVQTKIGESALSKNGSPVGETAPARFGGISAQKCAEKIFDAVRRGKEEALMGGIEVHAVWLKRHFPRISTWVHRCYAGKRPP